MKSLIASLCVSASVVLAAGGSETEKYTLFVGSAAGGPQGEALCVFECDGSSGAIKAVDAVNGYRGTTYFTLDAAGRYLYTAGAEIPPRRGVKADALRFPVSRGRLGKAERIARLQCESPCHVELFPGREEPWYASYLSAMLSGVGAGGTVKSAVLGDDGRGPNALRQKKAYAHQVLFTPDRRLAGVVNLGCDRIHFFDPSCLGAGEKLLLRLDPGDGPRHAVWSKDGRRLYVLNELSNSVSAFAYRGSGFSKIGKWPTLPEEFAGESKAAAIKLTADGGILMASNRGHDSIAFFKVDPVTGALQRVAVRRLAGAFPRDFELMPNERFMVVGHKHDNEVQMYRFDRAKLAIEPVGAPVRVWRPLCFKFAPVGAGK